MKGLIKVAESDRPEGCVKMSCDGTSYALSMNGHSGIHDKVPSILYFAV